MINKNYYFDYLRKITTRILIYFLLLVGLLNIPLPFYDIDNLLCKICLDVLMLVLSMKAIVEIQINFSRFKKWINYYTWASVFFQIRYKFSIGKLSLKTFFNPCIIKRNPTLSLIKNSGVSNSFTTSFHDRFGFYIIKANKISHIKRIFTY